MRTRPFRRGRTNSGTFSNGLPNSDGNFSGERRRERPCSDWEGGTEERPSMGKKREHQKKVLRGRVLEISTRGKAEPQIGR